VQSITQRLLKQSRGFSSPHEELFLALQIAADRAMGPWEAHLRKKADLTHVQYNVLRILRGAGKEGRLAGEIGERLIARSPDVTRLIDRLEQRSLVRRKTDTTDRRAVRVHITAAGRKLIDPLDDDAKRLMKETIGHVPDSQIIKLRDALNDLLEAMV
jgi:DNA-binding MarR family transcriptional regulator